MQFVSILSIAIGYAVLVAGFSIYLMPLQRAHYRPFAVCDRASMWAQLAHAMYVSALCTAWHWLLPAEMWLPLCIALAYLPLAIWLITQIPRIHLRLTARLMRLWLISAVLAAVPAVCFAVWVRYAVMWGLCSAAGYVVVQLAAVLTYPLETLRNRGFIRRMHRRLLADGQCVVGITGSAGKTGVKRLLLAALGDAAYATPGNYNTPMGIALAVRDMPVGKRYFLAEMGVGKPNDMHELLDMVVPHVGIVTCILPQHTAHFASMQDIRLEKCLLLDAAEWGICHTSVGYPAHSTYGQGGDWWAENVHIAVDGVSFDICSRTTRHHVTLPLLGRQHVDNAVAAWAVAIHLGATPAQIIQAWRHITPEPHRLTCQQNAAGVWIVDDSYNCNIKGAQYALEYIGLYTGRKVVSVSGIDESDPALALNKRLGNMIAEVADVVVIVGRRYRAELRQGIGDDVQVYEVDSTAASVPLYAQLLHAGDVLLIMADYPM